MEPKLYLCENEGMVKKYVIAYDMIEAIESYRERHDNSDPDRISYVNAIICNSLEEITAHKNEVNNA